MDRKEELKVLYSEIFGDKVKSLDYTTDPRKELLKIPNNNNNNNNKCFRCKDSCNSYGNIQDLPYFNKLYNIKTFVVAEAPGRGLEEGKMGFVFGWNHFEKDNARKTIRKYENYLFELLKLNREDTYITDAIKCYTAKQNFKDSFGNCKSYLEDEIKILRPKEVLVISKQKGLKLFLESIKSKYSFELKIIPHPSNQNISKIKTVSDIFKEVGNLTLNQEWIELGEQISTQYEIMKEKLS